MNLRTWFAPRGSRFVRQRGTNLLRRYGISPDKAIRRIDRCVDALAGLGCAPTFPTPGIVAQRHPDFFRHLENRGAEIAVHGYEHVDLSSLPLDVAIRQLTGAVETFERLGIEARGFRCPYLGWSQELRDALPAGLFDYSSNEAIAWEPEELPPGATNGFFETLESFYCGKPFSERVCVPETRSNLIEIPVCAPDDLQLYDGLSLEPEGMVQVWGKLLEQIYRRGELFTLVFHPELASLVERAFTMLLTKAGRFPLPIWVARLRDISEWWQEKSTFRVESLETPTGLRIAFSCSLRATILGRGFKPFDSAEPWEGAYYCIPSRILDLPPGPRPFVGLPAAAPAPLVSFIREQGYIVETGETARHCTVYLEPTSLAGMTQVQLVNHIEAASGPLVRFWRWPNGAKSALSMTGDLDALTLLDYAGRLLER